LATSLFGLIVIYPWYFQAPFMAATTAGWVNYYSGLYYPNQNLQVSEYIILRTVKNDTQLS
jgi:hypothetical protein